MDFKRPLAVVTPTLDGDVLAALARARASFTGREVHRLVGRASEEGIRKALRRLVRQGIVVAQPAGRAILYEFNREHIAARHIEGLANLLQSIIDQTTLVVGEWDPPPAIVALFGSVAEGTAGPESDLDLLVVRPDGLDVDAPEWRGQVDDLCERLTRSTGNDARLLEFGLEELVSADGPTDALLEEVAQTAIVVAGDLSKTLGRARFAGWRSEGASATFLPDETREDPPDRRSR